MKKIILCFLVILCGCSSNYTLIRNPQSDVIKIALVVDEKDAYLFENMTLNRTTLYVCNQACLDKLYEAENNYVDGLILMGENVMSALTFFDNKNDIPIIQIEKQNRLSALQEIYPDLIWQTDDLEIDEIDDKMAFYYEEDEEVKADVFYQNNHPDSICQLDLDKNTLETDINQAIDELIENQFQSNIIVKWIKK
ncbi:MAG: hypothetical protein ACI4U3_07330 [Traorella sp.]